MNYRLTLGLLSLLVLIGAFLYFGELQAEPKKEGQETQVLNLKAADVNSIVVSHQGQTTELKKEGAYWQLRKPEPAETQSGVVDGLVARMAVLNASRTLPGAAEPLATYGLETPRAEATLKTSDNRTTVLLIGDNTPDGSSSYVKRKDSDQVYVVSGVLAADVMRLVTNPPKALPTPTPTPRPIGTPVPVPTN